MRPIKSLNRRRFLSKSMAALVALLFPFLKKNKALAAFSFWRGSEYVGKTRDGQYEKFYVQYYKSFKRIEGKAWQLRVEGLCEKPQSFSLAAINQFPNKTQISRIKCVECWSAKAEWGGFSIEALDQIVRPKSEAVGLLFSCADGYKEYLSFEDLKNERTLLVHTMNKQPLSDEHGFPLRVIVPYKYGYKSAKAILEIEYVGGAKRGTWTKLGPYSADATILPGYDHPLDRGKKKRRITGGEIFD